MSYLFKSIYMRDQEKTSFGELRRKVERLLMLKELNKRDSPPDGVNVEEAFDFAKERNDIARQLDDMLGLGLENPYVNIGMHGENLVIKYDSQVPVSPDEFKTKLESSDLKEAERHSAEKFSKKKFADPNLRPGQTVLFNAAVEIEIFPDMSWEKMITCEGETFVVRGRK